MSQQYSSTNSNGQMAAHIVPFPSLAHSLSSLQYATSMQDVPIHHQGPKGRAAESEEKLKRAIQSSSSQTAPATSQGYYSAPQGGQTPTSKDYLMMRRYVSAFSQTDRRQCSSRRSSQYSPINVSVVTPTVSAHLPSSRCSPSSYSSINREHLRQRISSVIHPKYLLMLIRVSRDVLHMSLHCFAFFGISAHRFPRFNYPHLPSSFSVLGPLLLLS
ncbi:hypothetical protein BS47DRAFT_1489024 [Hydnum rufescens UP504]|uniref:Uncharacterized protein n=1 Tax=Hydnum rufescens UP504 TaxID=1448309 RepID=A0A9P6ALR2_9AGAM|nr:hypothetical protein BS47DRAFT_1489024 [Hydnum rufescens UP504]